MVVSERAVLAVVILAVVLLDRRRFALVLLVFLAIVAVLAARLLVLVDGAERCRRGRLLSGLSVHRLLERVGVARVSLLEIGGRALRALVALLRLRFILAAVLVDERASSTDMRARRVHSGLGERIGHILLARVPGLVDESGARLLGGDVAAAASWVLAGCGWQATEPASVELLAIRGFLVATGEALRLRGDLGLRVVETLRLEHHDLVVALIVRVLRVVRDAALGHDLAWPVRSVQVVRGGALLGIGGTRLIAHGRLSL